MDLHYILSLSISSFKFLVSVFLSPLLTLGFLTNSCSDRVHNWQHTQLWSTLAIWAVGCCRAGLGRGLFCNILIKSQYLSVFQWYDPHKHMSVGIACPLLLPSLAVAFPNNFLEVLFLLTMFPSWITLYACQKVWKGLQWGWMPFLWVR